jgi:ribosomal-protein-alanine N-acetyltransferase
MIALPVLESERLILRPIIMDDAQDMFEYASDDEVTAPLTWNTHKTIKETEDAIQDYFLRKGKDQFESYAVVLKDENKMIGTCDYMHHNKVANSAEIGFAFNKNYWGHGYATEATKRLIQFSFEVLKLSKLTISHSKHNNKSSRVVEKCGFKLLNETLDYLPLKDKKVETLNYQITMAEYKEFKGE